MQQAHMQCFSWCDQGRSQPHSPGWARVPCSFLIFPSNFNQFFLFFLKLYLCSSSFWPSGWASLPLRKALAPALGVITLYAVKVKRHNVCKRHVAIDTGFKQTERTIFLCVISMGKI